MKFALVKPKRLLPIRKEEVKILKGLQTAEEMTSHLGEVISNSPLLAVDIETNGTQAAADDFRIVGLSIASYHSIVYIDRATSSDEAWNQMLDILADPSLKLIAHNVFFDATALLKETGKWFNWTYCTYGLYRQLANEGWPGQKWGLKDAQTKLMGWAETNEVELDQWLIRQGLYADIKKEEKDGYYKQPDGKWYKPRKGEMYRAPAEILGTYCGIDAGSTLLLYDRVLSPAIARLSPEGQEVFGEYHLTFLDNVRLHAEQQLRGIELDYDQLLLHKEYLITEIEEAMEAFLTHPSIVESINDWNQMKIDEYQAREPKRLKKNGEISKNWLKWEEKMEEKENMNHFNLNSGPQKRWLFYEKLGYPVILKTEKGNPAVDSKALTGFGEVGQLLKRNNDATKELSYVESCVDHLIQRGSSHYIHPQFRIPGTLTGRLAGSGGLNIQQLPKSAGYLKSWRPRPGWTWVDCDHTSLEQVVLAELSKDPTLWRLYGPGAKDNDVYLFNGAHLPGLADDILGAGYDPNNPTRGGIARAKREAKKARGISKVITLGSSYGMGPNKLQMTLRLQGIDVSKDEAFGLWRSYHALYRGVKDYEAELLEQWKASDGWVFNGIGRPICVAEMYKKDLVNRVVQSTGHDIHMYWVSILFKLFNNKGLSVWPIIADFHDQSIVECRPEDAEEVKLTFEEAYHILNMEVLQGEIPIGGDAQIVRNLAEAKLD